ncbi:MAG: roadblock/LC7 domain-containing protein [Candidatus Odinarchaeota archaeon]
MTPIRENLDDLLERMVVSVPELKAAALITRSGIIIASTFPEIDEMKLGGMTIAFFHLAERAILEMRRGEFEQIFIKGNRGYLLFVEVEPDVVLVASLMDIRGFLNLNWRIRERILKLL